jgi:hypothetical protein
MTDEAAEWIPVVEDLAKLVPAYTRGGFDDDSPPSEYPGEEQGTFTESTSPTHDEVESLISTAADEVQGRVGRSIPERCFGLARSAVIWHVTADIAGTKIAAGSDDARGEYAKNIANFRASLDALIVEARRGPTRLV